MTENNIFIDYIKKGVVIGIQDGPAPKFFKAYLVDFRDPFLILSSFGKKSTIHKQLIISIREAGGVVR